MNRKPEPKIPCKVCRKDFPIRLYKTCYRCYKVICPSCTQFTRLYQKWWIHAWRFRRIMERNWPYCPQCCEEIEKENEELRAEEKREYEEIYGTAEERKRRDEELDRKLEEEEW